MTSRGRAILTHFAAGILGALVGAAIGHGAGVRILRTKALATCALAIQWRDVGNDDLAIVLLGQAIGEDPKSHVPMYLLGQIYSRRGNEKFGLQMYKRALEVLEGESDLQWERDPIRMFDSASSRERDRDSIRSKIAALEKRSDDQRRAPQGK